MSSVLNTPLVSHRLANMPTLQPLPTVEQVYRAVSKEKRMANRFSYEPTYFASGTHVSVHCSPPQMAPPGLDIPSKMPPGLYICAQHWSCI